jgi:hypothetical protein
VHRAQVRRRWRRGEGHGRQQRRHAWRAMIKLFKSLQNNQQFKMFSHLGPKSKELMLIKGSSLRGQLSSRDWKKMKRMTSLMCEMKKWILLLKFRLSTWGFSLPSDHLLLDSAPNLGPLISYWEINKFENCWYKSVRILEVLKVSFQHFLNLPSSQQDMSGSILGALSNNRWSWGIQTNFQRSFFFCFGLKLMLSTTTWLQRTVSYGVPNHASVILFLSVKQGLMLGSEAEIRTYSCLSHLDFFYNSLVMIVL